MVYMKHVHSSFSHIHDSRFALSFDSIRAIFLFHIRERKEIQIPFHVYRCINFAIPNICVYKMQIVWSRREKMG